MEGNNYSLSDVAALMGNKGFGSGDGLGWLILILLFMGGAWGGRGAGPAPMVPPNVATMNDVQTAVNNQTVNSGIQQVLLSSANNNYETAQLVNGQTNTLMQQNYANQINAIQGFNSVNQSLAGGFSNVSQQISAQTNALANQLSQLGYQMENCCCSIKTQMLNDRLDDRNRQLLQAQNQISNMQNAQFILGNMGRYVAWEGSGSATSSSIAS